MSILPIHPPWLTVVASSHLYCSCNGVKGILTAAAMNRSVTHVAVTHLALKMMSV